MHFDFDSRWTNLFRFSELHWLLNAFSILAITFFDLKIFGNDSYFMNYYIISLVDYNHCLCVVNFIWDWNDENMLFHLFYLFYNIDFTSSFKLINDIRSCLNRFTKKISTVILITGFSLNSLPLLLYLLIQAYSIVSQIFIKWVAASCICLWFAYWNYVTMQKKWDFKKIYLFSIFKEIVCFCVFNEHCSNTGKFIRWRGRYQTRLYCFETIFF